MVKKHCGKRGIKVGVQNQIDAKKKEAEGCQDQGCYNAAYCYGYVAGAEWMLENIFDAVAQKLPDMEDSKAPDVFCTNNHDEIMSKNESAINHLADAFEAMGLDVVTGYYDPGVDKRNGEEDALTGFYYLTM